MTTSPRGRTRRSPQVRLNPAWMLDELEPHWIPRFAPARSLGDNVFDIARPLWGKARAEWTMWLATDLIAEIPDADGEARREWVAAILWAAAIDAGMGRDRELWAHILDDIQTATGVAAECAQLRFDQLRDLVLDRPRNEPPYWRGYDEAPPW